MTADDAVDVADGYDGPFDPDWRLDRLSRAALARLCREYMLVAFAHDRSFMPHVAMAAGTDATIRQADGEWMGASPVYTARNRRALGITGDGAGDALKAFQFDIGFAHHFMDVRYDVVDHDRGSFWLPYCGAHHYVREITGNDVGLVTNMCHHMEDRTFDATLGVTNPKLRAIPVHRPPKPDDFTGEHCRWEIRIEHDEPGPREPEPSLPVIRSSAAAAFEFGLGESHEPGGMEDYSGPLEPGLRLDDLSHAVLVRQAKEFALDVHLLMRAAYWTADEHLGTAFLDEVAPQHRAAIAPVVVARLREALGIEGDDMTAVAKLLQVDPVLVPEYVAFSVTVHDERSGAIEFHDGAGLTDDVCRSPLDWLDGFRSTAQAVNPRCIVTQTGERSWDLRIDPDAEPVAPHWLADGIGGGGLRTLDLTARPVALRRRTT